MSSQWLTCHRYNMAYVAYGFASCGHRGSVDYRPPLPPVSQAADRTLEPELWGATADDRCGGSFSNGKPLHKSISMIHFGRGNHMLFLLGFGNYIETWIEHRRLEDATHRVCFCIYIYDLFRSLTFWAYRSHLAGFRLRTETGQIHCSFTELGRPKPPEMNEASGSLGTDICKILCEMIWNDLTWYDRLCYDMIW